MALRAGGASRVVRLKPPFESGIVPLAVYIVSKSRKLTPVSFDRLPSIPFFNCRQRFPRSDNASPSVEATRQD